MSSVPPNIQTYRLDPAAFERTTKRRIYRRLAWGVPFLILFVVIQWVVMGKVQEDTVSVLLIALLVGAVAVAFALFRAVRQQLKIGRSIWHSYELTISENVLRRHVSNLPPSEIIRSEVSKILDAQAEGLTVATKDRHRFIFIPEQLVGYEEVRQRLSHWKRFEPPKVARNRTISVGWSILLIGSWIGTGAIPDITLAMVSGLVLLGVGAITIRETLKLSVADNKTKAGAIGGVAFLLLAPFARLLLHFVYPVVGWH